MGRIRTALAIGATLLGIAYLANNFYQATVVLEKCEEYKALHQQILPTIREYKKKHEEYAHKAGILEEYCGCEDLHPALLPEAAELSLLKGKIDYFKREHRPELSQLEEEIDLANARRWNPLHGRL